MGESVPPNVESTTFLIKNKQVYYVDGDVKYRVTKMMIIANGTGDLCIASDSNGFATVRKIADVAADKILCTPKTDLLWITFEKPVRGTHPSMLCEINSTVKTMLDYLGMLGVMSGVVCGSDFDMYVGNDYILRGIP